MTMTERQLAPAGDSPAIEAPTAEAPPSETGSGYDPRRWRSLPIVLSATFMSLFDVFVVNVAAPSVQHELHASSATLELIVAAYSFTYAAGLVTGARLGDLVGRRRMFVVGLGLFVVASFLCGVAPSSGVLIAGPLAQGLPQVLAMLTVSFPPAERPRAFSLFGATVGLGTVSGQILGGVLLHLNILGLGWRPIFLVNVPIGIAAIVGAYRLLPESRARVADRLDPLGVVLLSTGIGAITAPLVLGRSQHWPLWTWASFLTGAVLVTTFLWWERRLGERGGHPLLPLTLFRHRAFNVGLLVNLGFFSFFGSVLLTLTIFLQEGVHDSPLTAGLTFWGCATFPACRGVRPLGLRSSGADSAAAESSHHPGELSARVTYERRLARHKAKIRLHRTRTILLGGSLVIAAMVLGFLLAPLLRTASFLA